MHLSAKPIPFTLPSPFSLPAEPKLLQPELNEGEKTRVLVAEDDAISRELICARLNSWGFDVVVTENGTDAMNELRKKGAPSLAILDWMMPGMDGVEICRRMREAERVVYLILLTALGSKEKVIEGLNAGADDYLTKPFHKEELRARILVGLRVMGLQSALAERVQQLEWAGAEIRNLRLQIPI